MGRLKDKNPWLQSPKEDPDVFHGDTRVPIFQVAYLPPLPWLGCLHKAPFLWILPFFPFPSCFLSHESPAAFSSPRADLTQCDLIKAGDTESFNAFNEDLFFIGV